MYTYELTVRIVPFNHWSRVKCDWGLRNVRPTVGKQ